jgi:hypothetical protein
MLASTRTAEEAAAACGVSIGQIVKSLVFSGTGSGSCYLFLVSGTKRVNEAKAADLVGKPIVRPDAHKVRALPAMRSAAFRRSARAGRSRLSSTRIFLPMTSSGRRPARPRASSPSIRRG